MNTVERIMSVEPIGRLKPTFHRAERGTYGVTTYTIHEPEFFRTIHKIYTIHRWLARTLNRTPKYWILGENSAWKLFVCRYYGFTFVTLVYCTENIHPNRYHPIPINGKKSGNIERAKFWIRVIIEC